MTRLDVWLAEQGRAESREKAQALVMAGRVRVDGRPATKPGTRLREGAAVEVDAGPGHVGRGALKLRGALDAFAHRSRGLRGRGHRRVDGRLHRDAARARRRARLCRRRRPRAAPRAAAPGPARRRPRPHQRARAVARDGARAVRARGDGRVLHLGAQDPGGAALGARAGRERRGAGQAPVRGGPRAGRQGRDREGPRAAPAGARATWRRPPKAWVTPCATPARRR